MRFGRLVIFAIALYLLLKFIGSMFSSEPAREGARHLTNRVWLDRMPSHERDLVSQLALVDGGKIARYGVAGAASRWRVLVDIVRFKIDRGGKAPRLDIELPQEGRSIAFHAKTWECAGEAPKPFDLCLDLRREDGRSFRFYSTKSWRFGVGADLDLEAYPQRLAPMVNAAAGSLSAVEGTKPPPSEAKPWGAEPLPAWLTAAERR